jgi:alkylation response protein AidB-like acyl-CoA dehydrogenase
MCLSEPQAGSSLADITTRAVADAEDELGRRYRIYGAKMWISAGDHDVTDNIVHLVLAKAAGSDGVVAQGTRGISLFIVPKRLPSGDLNDVAVAGLNHKMGYRGLPNCALNFGEGRALPDGRAGAVGWLVGEVGQGLPQMFQMMNEARVSVGLGAAMLASRGHLLSLAYAHTRAQGRPLGSRSGAPVPIAQHADVQRMLLAQKSYAEGALALVLYTARLLDLVHSGSDDEQADADALLAVLTPIAKTWPSEWAQRALDHAIQIHGGAGYTRDFDVELLYRDNRLNTIHEGTTGIQAIDLVGRKLRRDKGLGFDILQRRVTATLERARVHPAFANEALALSSALAALAGAAEMLMTEFEEAEAIAAATPFLLAAGHVVVGWLWLDQALCCEAFGQNSDAERTFCASKIAACRYFSVFELPKVSAWLSPILGANALGKILPTDVFAEP